MASKKSYPCPDPKCKKPIPVYVPWKREVTEEKPYWDGLTRCPSCGHMHFKRVYPGGKVEIVPPKIKRAPKDRVLKPGELAKRAGITDTEFNRLHTGITKYVKPGTKIKAPAAGTVKTMPAKPVKNGLYYYVYHGEHLCLVLADGNQRKGSKTTFCGTCIHDDSTNKQKGKYADNWDLQNFTFIPFNGKIFRLLSRLAPIAYKEGKQALPNEELVAKIIRELENQTI